MEELKLISKYPGSLRPLVEGALAAALRTAEEGIRQTEKRLQEFEAKYQLSTAEFLHRFNNDEFQHTLDFDEWIGEQRMLASLLVEKDQIKSIEFVN
ncbi:MAG: hypothetical protein GDA38_23835 [Hormoscilla sp. SP12CHS1]|nr:hypothetical protein [Hormoscilla sp. SP12CHS1]